MEIRKEVKKKQTCMKIEVCYTDQESKRGTKNLLRRLYIQLWYLK